MKASAVVAVVLIAASGVGAGYWWGQRGAEAPRATGSIAAGTPGASAAPARKLLYYRNPMGLPDTSPVPKKDPMGMDYVPVYEGDAPSVATPAGEVALSADKIQKLGVRTEAVALRSMDSTVHAAGRVEIDERRVYTVAPKFEGWVERLMVNATGQPVAKGQVLFEAYSPELVSAQREHAIAADGVQALKDAGPDAQASMQRLADSSLARLRNWDIPEEQVRALAQGGEWHRTLTFRSPVSGVVMEKKALQGQRFMPGEALYQIADLSSVWVIADVYERDLAAVRRGSTAHITFAAYPGETFTGLVTYVYPTLKPETRTVPVRIELANPHERLKPNMFGDIELVAASRAKTLAVPTSAVIDSGSRQVVLVEAGEGRFQPRTIHVGARTADLVEVRDGLREGERVVVTANFLIDAESNLKAALASYGAAGQDTPAAAAGRSVGHAAEGQVEAVDARTGTLTIAHGAVPSLKWPPMTMDFQAANQGLLAGIGPGARVAFEFVERAPGEYVVTSIRPADRAPAAPGSAPGH